MSAILDLISNFIEITGNSIADNIILAVIGVISFMVAFGIVGMIFDALGVSCAFFHFKRETLM